MADGTILVPSGTSTLPSGVLGVPGKEVQDFTAVPRGLPGRVHFMDEEDEPVAGDWREGA